MGAALLDGMKTSLTANCVDDLASTLLTRFCCRQVLRNLFTSLTLPPAVRQLIPTFVHSFQSDTRGTLLAEILAQGPSESQSEHSSSNGHTRFKTSDYALLPDDIIKLLRGRLTTDYSLAGHQDWTGFINPYVVRLNSLEDRGALYKVSDYYPGDSNVIFTGLIPGQWRAGQIARIFRYEQSHEGFKFVKNYLVVREFAPLTRQDSRLDPYRNFPVAGGQLFYNAFKPEMQLLTVEDVLCHFAMLPRHLLGGSVKCVHILPLDRVSYGLLIAHVLIKLTRCGGSGSGNTHT